MCGKDGCLYELDYHQDEGWFRGKCRKRNHSQNFRSLLPTLLQFGVSLIFFLNNGREFHHQLFVCLLTTKEAFFTH
jgi:hypothetical protein